MVAFAGVAQFLPSLLGGIFWRGATRNGALFGLLTGFAFWAYTLFLPSFGGDVLLSSSVIEHGLFGVALLKPQALFGLEGFDPLVHAVIWSVGANALVFFLVSSLTKAGALERLQAALFVDVFHAAGGAPVRRAGADTEDLLILGAAHPR